MQAIRIIDGDGHLNEPPEEVARFLPPPYRDKGFRTREQLVPPLDHLHFRIGETPAMRSGRGRVGPEEWLAFLDDVGIECTVLYTTLGLSVGNINSRDWAIAFTAAYNDWLHATYVTRSPRFQGMALLPMQEPEAAVDELVHLGQEGIGLGPLAPGEEGRHADEEGQMKRPGADLVPRPACDLLNDAETHLLGAGYVDEP